MNLRHEYSELKTAAAIKRAAIVCCGRYTDSGHKCPGDWKCYEAAALGQGKFEEPCQVISFLRCECPMQEKILDVGMLSSLLQLKPDIIHLSFCLVNASQPCPLGSSSKFARLLLDKTGIPVILGTHNAD